MIRLILMVAFLLGFILEGLAAVGSAHSFHIGRSIADTVFSLMFLVGFLGLLLR